MIAWCIAHSTITIPFPNTQDLPTGSAHSVRYSSGVICIGMEGDRMDELKLPTMLENNEDPKGTAFSVTVDASKEHGA